MPGIFQKRKLPSWLIKLFGGLVRLLKEHSSRERRRSPVNSIARRMPSKAMFLVESVGSKTVSSSLSLPEESKLTR